MRDCSFAQPQLTLLSLRPILLNNKTYINIYLMDVHHFSSCLVNANLRHLHYKNAEGRRPIDDLYHVCGVTISFSTRVCVHRHAPCACTRPISYPFVLLLTHATGQLWARPSPTTCRGARTILGCLQQGTALVKPNKRRW
jgi:hypothetical protein